MNKPEKNSDKFNKTSGVTTKIRISNGIIISSNRIEKEVREQKLKRLETTKQNLPF
jgi:hypothetical protein